MKSKKKNIKTIEEKSGLNSGNSIFLIKPLSTSPCPFSKIHSTYNHLIHVAYQYRRINLI